MALHALAAELGGADDDADRAYRAARCTVLLALGITGTGPGALHLPP
jgi:hypothetical protein